MSRSSGSEERQHESEGHTQNQPAEKEPPSPPFPSFLEQNFDIPLGWLFSGVVENRRLWL
jgi:hypothetical protein